MNTISTTMSTTKRLAARLWVSLALVGGAIALVPGLSKASQAGPGGANVGFDFTWDDAKNPAGHSASFLEADGVTANNCSGGPLTATTKTCNFVFDYQIGGVAQPSAAHAARYISSWTNPTGYVSGAPVANTGCNSPTNGAGDLGKAPLTLFDCFNSNAFGQVFRAGSAGPLTQFRASMTCLAPGGTRYELYALLYEMSADGSTIAGSAPLGATLVNLASCPTATTWKGKAFGAKDFAKVAVNLGSPALQAGKFYGVYFTGPTVPGTAPAGAIDAMQRAKTAATTTTTSTTTTTTTPWSSFRNQNNTKAPAATTTSVPRRTTAPATTTTTVPAALFPGNVPIESTVMTAIRLMTPGAEKTYVVNSLTPATCLGAGRNLVLLRTGRCRAQIALRTNGSVQTTVTTNVSDGTPAPSEVILTVDQPTLVYFRNGTALSTEASRKRIVAIASAAKRADAVLVTGHTGNAGGESDTMRSLSQKRAKAARSILRDRGVTGVIAIQSYGASQTVTNSKKDAQQALNRRAEIFLIP